jgi:hypothetical protein
MRITQGYGSPAGRLRGNEFFRYWNLREYDNPEEPVVFFGLYPDWDGEIKKMMNTSQDMKVYNNHKGFKVLLCGSPEYEMGYFNRIDKESLNLVAVDDWEVKACKALKLPYKHLKIPYFDFDNYQPTPLGDKIYSHIVMGEKEGEWGQQFNWSFKYEKLMKLFGEDMFCFPKEWVMAHEMLPYFNQSFVNIKPHKIRGYVTSWKLGVMGRNTITVNTEDAPNFIHYSTDDELKRLVDEESKKIGTIQNEISEKTRNYFHQSDDWLHEDYWK